MTEADIDTRQRFHHRIMAGATLAELRELLVEFRDRGGSRDQAKNMLEKLREQASDEAYDDRVLELLDIATDFVSPHQRVWTDTQP